MIKCRNIETEKVKWQIDEKIDRLIEVIKEETERLCGSQE